MQIYRKYKQTYYFSRFLFQNLHRFSNACNLEGSKRNTLTEPILNFCSINTILTNKFLRTYFLLFEIQLNPKLRKGLQKGSS